MKKQSLLVLFSLVICASFAQSSVKEETKFWKEKAKGYVKAPLSLKEAFENFQKEIDDLTTRNTDLVNRLTEIEKKQTKTSSRVDSLNYQNVQLNGKLQESEKRLVEAEKEAEKLKKALSSEKKVNDMGIKPGLVYTVQIGAYVNYEAKVTPMESENFKTEKADGFNKYMMGNFRTIEEANAFKGELRSMGVKDAWVVPYIDGVRVTNAEASSYLTRQDANAAALMGEEAPAPEVMTTPPTKGATKKK